MSNLANILAPTGNNLPLRDQETSELANQSGGDSDFDDVMSQAMAQRPAAPKTESRLRTSAAVSRQTSAAPETEEESATETPGTASDSHLRTAPTSSDDTHTTEKTGNDSKSFTAEPSPSDPDNFQNIPIPFLAPTFTAPLPSPSFAPGSTTKNFTSSASPAVDTAIRAAFGDMPAAKDVAGQKIPDGTPAADTGSSETGTRSETGKAIAAALKSLGLKPDDSTVTESASAPGKKAASELTATKDGHPDTKVERSEELAGQPVTAASTAGKNAATLKDLGLQPDVAAKAASPENAPNADKIAGAIFTTAKNDLPPADGQNSVNVGISSKNGGQAASISTGTGVAQDEMPMKKAEITNPAAGQTEKVLPGQTVSAARASNLQRTGSAPAASTDLPTATNIIPFSSAEDRNANATSNSDAVAVANLSDIQARAMERTHDMVTTNALRLATGQTDTMQVVLKPGAGTELSLELRQHGGIIEAQAVLQHGDYQNLSQHWPDLQQRLEQKGIKLAALTSDESSLPFNGNQGNSKNQDSSEHEALFASAFAEFSLASVMHAASATPVANLVRSGFETWA